MPALQQLTQPVSKIALVAFVKALQPPVLARGHSIRCRFRYPTPARLRPAGRLDAGNRHAAKACRCSGYASGSGEGVVSGASPVSSDGRSFPASSSFSQCKRRRWLRRWPPTSEPGADEELRTGAEDDGESPVVIYPLPLGFSSRCSGHDPPWL